MEIRDHGQAMKHQNTIISLSVIHDLRVFLLLPSDLLLLARFGQLRIYSKRVIKWKRTGGPEYARGIRK